MSTSAPHFFISYSRDDAAQQRRIIAELRSRGINVWVDIENLIPGSPAWEREIERAIRAASGMIVLLSPDSNNSEWVRREISFAEQNNKRIFPVLIFGDEDDSIPLRLSSHQRVDVRRNFRQGMDELADALRDHLGVTAVSKSLKQKPRKPIKITPADLKKIALPGLFTIIGLACMGGLALTTRLIYGALNNLPTQTATIPPDLDPVITPTATEPVIVRDPPTGKIVYTCQIAGDEICIINADGSGWRRLTDFLSGSHYASLSPDGDSVIYVGKESGNTEIHEINLSTGKTKQLTRLETEVGSPEISPDNQFIIFTYRPSNNIAQVWIMNRDGSDPHEFFGSSSQESHDPTWSPDGTQILFAMGRGDHNKLYVIDFDGREPKVVNDTVDTRGRSDWSDDLISFDMGDPYLHDIYLMNTDGNRLRKVSQGNNSQGASLSPDGKWIAFTAYTADPRTNSAACEIFIVRVDGTDLLQLTNNGYCDYQPRWGK